jgi:UDP-N-acetylmuramate: L-alanyl-gamma-D-glutamyl-meso-diaminopimelate ligase
MAAGAGLLMRRGDDVGGDAVLAVAGEGAATTAAIAAWLLVRAGSEPGFALSRRPADFDASTSPARARLPVVRASLATDAPLRRAFVTDAYERAVCPAVVVLASGAGEGAAALVASVPVDGWVFAPAEDARAVGLARGHARATLLGYALGDEAVDALAPHWLAAPAESDGRRQSFDLYAGGVYAGRAAVALPDRAGLRSALAAVAAVCHGFGVSVATAMHLLPRFPGLAPCARSRRA